MRARLIAGGLLMLVATTMVNGEDGHLPLIEAVKRRDAAAIRALLAQRVDVSAPQADGATALHWASYLDDRPAAELLIRAGARVNAANHLGATPLWLASENGSAAMLELLLKAGADPKQALPMGETPLMTAARAGAVEAVGLLLAHGADPAARESVRGQTALMWAVAQRHPKVVKMLIEHGADINARTRVVPRVVKLAGRDGAVIDEQQGGFTPLLFAARVGDAESARWLLAAGANPNDAAANGATALIVATHSDRGHHEMTAALLTAGADPNAAPTGYSALHAAVLRGDLGSVKVLLAAGANPNLVLSSATPVRRRSVDWAMNEAWLGATPFWLAAKFSEVEIMRMLAAAGARSDIPSKTGTTPLMAAILGVVDRWGDAPADTTGKYHTPLDGDEERRNIEATAKLLIELRADVNQADAAGDTALHIAAVRGLDTMASFLISQGAAVNATNARGQTPLAMTSLPRRTADEDDAGGGDGRRKTADLLRRLGAK